MDGYSKLFFRVSYILSEEAGFWTINKSSIPGCQPPFQDWLWFLLEDDIFPTKIVMVRKMVVGLPKGIVWFSHVSISIWYPKPRTRRGCSWLGTWTFVKRQSKKNIGFGTWHKICSKSSWGSSSRKSWIVPYCTQYQFAMIRFGIAFDPFCGADRHCAKKYLSCHSLIFRDLMSPCLHHHQKSKV